MGDIAASVIYIILFLLFPTVVGTLTLIFLLVSWILICDNL